MAKMPAFADAAKKHAFPDKTYTDKLTVLGGNDAIDLYYFGPAHTNGDTLRGVPRPAGDALRRRVRGQGHAAHRRNNGGSGVTYPETMAKAAAGIKDVDTVIPGHSAVTTWAALRRVRRVHAAFLDRGAEGQEGRQDRRPGRRRARSCPRSSRTT